MIKRLLLALAVLVTPIVAFADAANRDTLLAQNGTLYTIESVRTDEIQGLTSASTTVLRLTTTIDEQTSETIVPASFTEGMHLSPALAFDAESGLLFVIWEHSYNNGLDGELVLSANDHGKWSPVTKIDSGSWKRSRNLRVGITRKTETVDEDGNRISVPELTVHAAWWSDGTRGSSAKYAMLTIDKGAVKVQAIKDLADFGDTSVELPADPTKSAVPPAILNQPVLFESDGRATIDVLYGDERTQTLRRVTLKPVAQGRLRVPVGIRVQRVGAPEMAVNQVDGRMAGFSSGDHLALYFRSAKKVQYVTFTEDGWSPLKSVSVNEKVTADAAIDALRRMVGE